MKITAMSEDLNNIVSSHRVVIFGTAWCPFCTRCRNLFEDFGLQVFDVDIDDAANSAAYDAMKEREKFETVPAVYVNGEFIGGCDDACTMADSGKLQAALNLPTFHLKADREERPPMSFNGLFQFGPVAERWIAQVVGVEMFVLSVICIIWRTESWAHWVVFGMFVDFIIRFIFGGPASLAGSVAMLLTCKLDPIIMPGPPKQFAAACGIFFTGMAAALMLLSDDDDTQEIGGSVFLGILAFAASLEGFFNFCIGCFVFSWAVRLGIVSKDVYRPYTDTAQMIFYTVTEMHTKLGWGKLEGVATGDRPAANPDLVGWRRRLGKQYVPEPQRVLPIANGPKSVLDVAYKFPKTDDTTRERFSARYVEFDDFGMVLGIGGLAAAFRMMYDVRDDTPKELWMTLAIMAAAIYGLLLLCMIYKCIVVPNRLWMDMMHPMKRNGLSAILLCNMLFAFLLRDYNDTLRHIMYWAGVPAAWVHLVWTMMSWVKNHHTGDHITPAIIYPIATCIFSGLTGHVIDLNLEASTWFTTTGIILLLLFLAVTLGQGMTYHWADDRVRATVALWMGSFFIAQLAITQKNGWGDLSFGFYGCGCVMFLMCVCLAYPGRWLLRGKFEMAYWAVAFPLDVFAMSATNYHAAFNDDEHKHFGKGIMYLAFAFACWANVAMLMHTLTNLFCGRWPRPQEKWAPLSFNKLQHEAMREIIAKLLRETSAASGDRNEPIDATASEATFQRINELWSEYVLLVGNHAATEDDIYFPEIGAFNRKQFTMAEQQHHELDASLAAANKARDANNATTMYAEVEKHLVAMLDHIQWEEDHIQSIVRKQLNLALHHRIVRRIFDAVPLSDWEQTFPLVVSHLPMHGQRVRYVKSFLWTMPERAHTIGTWLYRGLAKDPLGEMKWAMLMNDLPEIAPRGTWSHQRYL
eukprot:PhM_4_TR8469/c2_g1_i3/m.47352